MNFARTLIATILIAIFGAIVLAKAPVGAPPGSLAHSLGHALLGAATTGTFTTVFLGAAATLSVAFLSIFLLEEKPLGEARPGSRR